MGDRVLFQVVSESSGKFSPVIYGHWSGECAPEIANSVAKRMADRPGDVEYAAARLVQEMIADSKGNTGFGIWNSDRILTPEDSHGDAGVCLIHADKGYSHEFICGYHRKKEAA